MLQQHLARLAAIAVLGAPGAVRAADPDLAAIRAQIEEMKQSYEQRIAALEEKLARAEARDPAPAPVVPAPAAPAGATAFNPEVSLILQGQYRQMKDIEERGITGFLPAGHDHGGPSRGFAVDHTELVLAANVDPFWRAQGILALVDGEVEVEEAWFQSLGLGHGLGLKGGRFRSGLGYLNEQHPHQWDFADAPLMYQALFGSHGSYTQDGLQLKWLAPTPLFLEIGAEAGRGQSFPGTDRNKNGSGAGALFAHLGGDVGDSNSWRAGLSYLRTSARDRAAHFENLAGDETEGAFTGRSRTWLADFVWKWAPDGNPKYRNFKFQAEYFERRENGELGAEGAADDYRSRQSGWYAQGVYQFSPHWRAGYRYDRLKSGRVEVGDAVLAVLDPANAAFASYHPSRHSVMADYSWSEFSRVRLQYARDESMQGVTDHQVTLQYIMSLGAHGAHRF